jgi:hypothetical protein
MNFDFLDPQQPWYKAKIGDAQWDRMKAKLTGGTDAGGTSYSKIVSVTDTDADTIITNMKKDPRGYPQMNMPGGAEQYKNMQAYYNFLVDEYLEKPFREQTDEKIRQAEVKAKLKEVLDKKAKPETLKKALSPSVAQPPKVTPVQEMVAPPKPLEAPKPAPTPPSTSVPETGQTSKLKDKKPKPVKHQKLESGMVTVLKRVEKSLKETVSVIGKSNDDLEIRLENQSNLLMSGFTKVTNVINSVARSLREQTDTIEQIANEQSQDLEKNLDKQSVAREQASQEKIDGSASNTRLQKLKKVLSGKQGGQSGSMLKNFLGSATQLGSARGITRLMRRLKNPRRTMTAARRLARMRLKGIPFVGNQLAKQGSKLVNFGAKAFRPIASPIGKKIVSRIGGKTIAKAVGKGVGKSLIKKVPLLGAVAGVAFGIERAMKGDWLGALGEVASGVASTVPGVGTAVSTGIDAALIAKDVAGAETGGEIPGITSLAGANSKGEYDRARRDAGIQDLTVDSFVEEENAKLDWQKRNRKKIARIFGDGYQLYFPPALAELASKVWDNIKSFFKDVGSWIKTNLMGREGDGFLGPRWLNLRNPFAGGDMPEATGDYDIIIPLDHMKSGERIPDYEGGNTYENSAATGAAGREREHQDLAAKKLKTKLEAGGLKVKIVAPEEFSSYEKYDEYIRGESEHGTRILPLHFDAGKNASGKLVGTGFLTRVRSGDSEDMTFAAPIQKALEEFQKENTNLGRIGPTDTVGNATVNAGAKSPAALLELGIMVWWEKEVGKNFTESAKFDTLITGVADGILETTKPRTPPPAPVTIPGVPPISSTLNEESGRYALPSYLSQGYTVDPSTILFGGQKTQTVVVPGNSGLNTAPTSFLDMLEAAKLAETN